MVLKGLALGAAMATVAVALFVALTFQPTRATVTAPASNVVMLPNGMAAPQLQPAQQGAPALVEAETSLLSMVRSNIDSAGSAALALRAELTAPPVSSSSYLLHSCSGD